MGVLPMVLNIDRPGLWSTERNHGRAGQAVTILTPDEIRLFADPPSSYSDLAVTALAALSVAKRLAEGWTAYEHDGKSVWRRYVVGAGAHMREPNAMSDDEAAVLAMLGTTP